MAIDWEVGYPWLQLFFDSLQITVASPYTKHIMWKWASACALIWSPGVNSCHDADALSSPDVSFAYLYH